MLGLCFVHVTSNRFQRSDGENRQLRGQRLSMMLASNRRNSPLCAFAVEVDFVLDSPKSPCAENVIYRVNNARQEDAFL